MIIIIANKLIHLQPFIILLFIINLHSIDSVTAHKSHKHNTNLPCQDSTFPSPLGYRCNANLDHAQCSTFALLRANSYFPSLSKLAASFGIDRFSLQQANGFSPNTDFLPLGHPLLIPINCFCNNKDSLYDAYLNKLAAKGDSFYSIYNSLQGLTTCNAIKDKNPNVIDVKEKQQLLIPLRCACPSSSFYNVSSSLLLTYSVNDGDTVSKLASQFNVTKESILSANLNSFSSELSNPDNVLPVFRTLLIPLTQKPDVDSLPYNPLQTPKKKKKKRKMFGMYIGLIVSVLAAGIAIAVVFRAIKRKRKIDHRPRSSNKMTDVEVQQLSLSIRTTVSDKKISFDLRSQDTIDGHIIDAANPHKSSILEIYTGEEIKKATDEFDSSNLIEGSVYQGRLNGKNVAIKKTNPETISKIDFGFFQDSTHHHPNIIRLIGTGTGNSTAADGSDSFLVFEYAENGSLKDWLHGGLAMKSQFIASCYCFLNWNQRLKICLDVAIALQYMHKIKNPSYIHRNIKSRNIFLDDEFNAKVGNFAMGKCIEDEIHSCLNRAYLAPEYLKQRIVSPSMDIFAYGVVLMEILSGRPPVTKCEEKGEVGSRMSEKIKVFLKRENAVELLKDWMDNALGDEYSIEAAVAVVNLAVACVEEEARARPSAGEIVEKLSRLAGVAAGSPEGESATCESSSKPLVKAAVTTKKAS
ncbi:protein LYK2 [Impatiens glandulifera]|uniref:protein LYK2 n=1 Tax=Impatiens glandulifera TaxID=253017 RepID=UPI001FB0D8F5|nr:protein LYK2 [Impatiens glandulifera]